MGKTSKTVRRKPSTDRDTYSPRLNKTEQAARHRKAQAAYYARDAIKAGKRRWDPPRPPKSIAKSIVDDPGELSDDHLDAETPGLPDGELWMVPSSSSSPLPDPRGTMSWEEQDPAQEARLEYRHAAAANSTHFADRDSAGSPTSQERIAIEALASLAGPTAAQGTRGPVSVDSILEKAMQLSSLRCATTHFSQYLIQKAFSRFYPGVLMRRFNAARPRPK
ncbi:hypothetical protein B0H12DRAFT_1078827 [Mycena haematopus]|nr:hypothetical protein B0H12DRAFT_1078827 [Mycena haematopus]